MNLRQLAVMGLVVATLAPAVARADLEPLIKDAKLAYLKNGDKIDFTQSAFVLENLIGQVLANFAKSKGDAPAASGPDPSTPAATAAPATKPK